MIPAQPLSIREDNYIDQWKFFHLTQYTSTGSTSLSPLSLNYAIHYTLFIVHNEYCM